MCNGAHNDMYGYVKEMLAENDIAATKNKSFPFRRRSEHIWRVVKWTERLIDGNGISGAIDTDSLLAAAVFHDSGYAISIDGSRHAANSAVFFDRYVAEKGLACGNYDFTRYLISNHSNKYMMDDGDTPTELVTLMEADLLDETGAMSIVWDCMMEGGQDEQSFLKTYRHMESFSGDMLENNPMKTKKAREIWAGKQDLYREFLRHLAYDLAVGD
ncbi:MAG: hypothetical protein FWH01_06090 [Oscillospiraceae bacterium]|nr:hypothetical protein [Oscillospiraceae bacterium]